MTSGLRLNENERYTVPPITAGCLLRLRTFMQPLKILLIFLAWPSEQNDDFEVLSKDSWKKSLNKKAKKKKLQQPGNVEFEQSASLSYKGRITRNTKRLTFHLLKKFKSLVSLVKWHLFFHIKSYIFIDILPPSWSHFPGVQIVRKSETHNIVSNFPFPTSVFASSTFYDFFVYLICLFVSFFTADTASAVVLKHTDKGSMFMFIPTSPVFLKGDRRRRSLLFILLIFKWI